MELAGCSLPCAPLSVPLPFWHFRYLCLGGRGSTQSSSPPVSHFTCAIAQRSTTWAVRHRNMKLPWLWHRKTTGQPLTNPSYFLQRFSVKGNEENDSDVFRHTVTSTVHTLGIHAGIQWISVLNSLSVTCQESKAKKSSDLLYLKGSSICKNDFKFFWQQLLTFQGVVGFFRSGCFGVQFGVRIIRTEFGREKIVWFSWRS